MCVLVAQSCLILCDPMDCSPPGSSVHGILQARILDWVAISFFWGCWGRGGGGVSSYPGIKTQSPAFQVDSLPSEPPGKQDDILIVVTVILHTLHFEP